MSLFGVSLFGKFIRCVSLFGEFILVIRNKLICTEYSESVYPETEP
jgi:hypothetical protein